MEVRMYKDVEYYERMIGRLKKMCRERTREINRIYYGGFSSREQCNFDGQLEIMKEVMQITDRRKKNYE
jgi:hypothetical protein|tara:strand:+ start:194 stop:400 length:207 start_codon:yes stop_codon:yes gene_type:complete